MAGETTYRRRMHRVVPIVVSSLLVVAASTARADYLLGATTTDADGVLHVAISSNHQGTTPNELRIWVPPGSTPTTRRFLYVLPVEAGTASAFGDPMTSTLATGLAAEHDLVIVVPAFTQLPWYANHPTDPQIQQESFLVDDVVPAVESLVSVAGRPRRLLLGFSKSGMGAISMIFRHDALFDAAAAWDATLGQTMLSGLPGGTPIFGTQENLDQYAIPPAIPRHVAEHRGSPRLWLGGYSSERAWRADMIVAHDAMVSVGMAHVWVDGPQREHRWMSGWLPDAITFLSVAAPVATPDASTSMPDAALDDAATGDAATIDAAMGDAARFDAGTGDATDAARTFDVPSLDASTSDGSGGDTTSVSGCHVAGRSGLTFGWLVALLVLVRRRRSS